MRGTGNMLKPLLIGLLLVSVAASAQEIDWPIDWPYEDNYGDDLVYLHAIANYETHPLWVETWQNNLFRKNMIRVNYASVAQTELFSDVGLVINEELIPGLWFRYGTNYLATQHRNEQDIDHSIGMEKSLYKTFSIFVYGNPKFEKEEIDIQYGLSFTNEDRSNYIRVAYVDVAPFWDDKNDQNSSNLKRPWQIAWQINAQAGRFRFFSEGRYDDGIAREFDTEAEPLNNRFQASKTDDMIFSLYYYRSTDSFIELTYSYYTFNETREFENTLFGYDYKNRIDLYKLAYITPLGEKYRLRFGSHGVSQKASATGYREHDYSHREIIPFIFWEWFIGPGIFETGYMGSVHQWDYEGQSDIDDPHFDGYIDKIELAYTFDFDSRAMLKIGVSQMASLSGFGGGNVQFFMDF